MDKSKLDLKTLYFVAKDLVDRAQELQNAKDTGLLGTQEQEFTTKIDTLYSMSKYYSKLAHDIGTTYQRQKELDDKNGVSKPATKRPRDFMSQAVSFVLDARTGPQSADEILKRILSTPSIMQMLPRRPEKSHVAETLSAGSRGSNPRFIRVKMGLYKNNPNYKKAK